MPARLLGFGPDLRDDLSAFGGKKRCDFPKGGLILLRLIGSF